MHSYSPTRDALASTTPFGRCNTSHESSFSFPVSAARRGSRANPVASSHSHARRPVDHEPTVMTSESISFSRVSWDGLYWARSHVTLTRSGGLVPRVGISVLAY